MAGGFIGMEWYPIGDRTVYYKGKNYFKILNEVKNRYGEVS